MSVCSSEMLYLGVAVKQSLSFCVPISCLIENVLDRFIRIGDNFCAVIDNDVQFYFVLVFDQQTLI